MNRYVVGVDLGSQHDYTAVCVAQVEREEGSGELKLVVRHLDRYRHKLYPEVAREIRELMLTPPLKGNAELIIDATGVGPAVTHIYREQRIKHKAVIIHGGERETFEQASMTYRVPKLDLVQFLLLLFHKRRFHVAQDLPHRDTLAGELTNFRRQINENTGHQRFSHREGEHDDLVLAASLAAWGAKRFGGVIPASFSTGSTGPFDHGGEMPFEVDTSGPFSLGA